MDDLRHAALVARLTALADDELVLAHRNAEWTGHAPILEEDIALANLAQDELGHAIVWFGLLETLTGTSADALAMFRPPPAFRNVQLVELPRGDWALTMLRQYLFDAYEAVLYPALVVSAYAPLAAAAQKMRREELYHLRHTRIWVERLGLGTDESNGRMQAALDALWPYCVQLFMPLPTDGVLVTGDDFPAIDALRAEWLAQVVPHLMRSGLRVPPARVEPVPDRAEHTPHLADLLADMQRVARSDPAATW